MNSLKTIERRHMIPRWQSFDDAYNSGELLYQKKFTDVESKADIAHNDILKAKDEWQKEKSVLAAIEYLQIQKLSNEETDINAVDFVKNAFYKIDKIPNEIENFINNDWNIENQFDSSPNIVSRIRKDLSLNCENAYLWLELARHSLILGNVNKSEKYLLIARNLAPNDRYIGRSLMRFYHHIDDVDKALYYIEKMENLYKDPMLLSGEIALKNVIGKTSSNIRLAKSIIESQKYSPVSISELTSEIATMEIINGKERVGKRLLGSCDNLTENSFAQVAWINQKIIKIPWLEEVYNNRIPNNYEGEIYLNFVTKTSNVNWEYLYEQCKLWNAYQPFSRSPIYMGGIIATDFMDNPKEAYDFSLTTLNSHKEDAGVLNNLAYSSIMNNDKSNALKFLKMQEIKAKTDEDIVLHYATKGLFEFRFGTSVQGKEMYKNASDIAKRISKKLNTQVLAYYYRELDRIGEIVEKEIVKNEILKDKTLANDFMLYQLLKKFKIIL